MNRYDIQDRVKYWIKTQLDHYPEAYMQFLHYKYKNHRFAPYLVSKSTNIVIEGFPRSANSFAVRAFNALQEPSQLKVATHVHSPSQIICGIKKGIPTLVLIRKPDECLISLKALNHEYHEKYKDRYPYVEGFNHLAKYYINFYKRLEPYYGDIVVSDFKRTINNFESVIRQINNRFNTSFNNTGLTEEKKKHIFNNFGFHLSPSTNRNKLKERLRKEFEENCKSEFKEKMHEIYTKVCKYSI